MSQKTEDKLAKSKDDETAPAKVVLSERHAINNEAAQEPVTEETKVQPAAVSSKPKIIVPISDVSSPKSKTVENGKTSTAPELSSAPEAASVPEEKPKEENVDASAKTDDEEVANDEAKAEEVAEESSTDTEDDTETASEDKPNKDAQKALKEAEEAEERNKQLEDYIEKKEYFVPINAVAEKRSIKYSLFMTLIVFLLAVALVDLMLDTGTILLLQKVPHTHFFSLSNN